MAKRKSYEIGFSHGNRYGGLNNWMPGARRGAAKAEYEAGFDAGQAFFGKRTYPERAYMAWLNKPRATRGKPPFSNAEIDAAKAIPRP